jgi:hypothetical protein
VDGPRSDIGAIERPAAPPAPVDPANPGQPADPDQPADPGPPVTPAKPATGPEVRIGPERLRLTRKGRARLRVSCPATARERCLGMLRLERTVRGNVRLAGRRRFSVPSGRAATVRVRVSRGLRRSVGRKPTRVQVVASVRDAVSPPRSTQRTVTVRRPAR